MEVLQYYYANVKCQTPRAVLDMNKFKMNKVETKTKSIRVEWEYICNEMLQQDKQWMQQCMMTHKSAFPAAATANYTFT